MHTETAYTDWFIFSDLVTGIKYKSNGLEVHHTAKSAPQYMYPQDLKNRWYVTLKNFPFAESIWELFMFGHPTLTLVNNMRYPILLEESNAEYKDCLPKLWGIKSIWTNVQNMYNMSVVSMTLIESAESIEGWKDLLARRQKDEIEKINQENQKSF